MKEKIFHSFTAVFCSILLILVDRLSKNFAIQNIKTSETQNITVIKGIFRLTYLQNKGAAWGIFPNMQMIFVIFCLILIVVVTYYYWKFPFTKKYFAFRIVAVLLTAGAIGNMIDRIIYGYVVDFFEFLFISFPVFNFADIYLTTSAILLLLLILFVYKEDDFIFLNRKTRESKR